MAFSPPTSDGYGVELQVSFTGWAVQCIVEGPSKEGLMLDIASTDPST